ncbi:MAG: adenylyltransferase/cytidyltransferase family protein [Promethearchaeota archaeon]
MRVLVTGCFDILHPGHIFLFQEAAKIGEVYVIVARDSTIEKWKKQRPVIPELQRLEMIKAIKYVTYATLGNEHNNFLEKALSLKPDLILLGPNQKISISKLKELLSEKHAEHIQVHRLEKLNTKFPLYSSSSIKKRIIEHYLQDQQDHI